MSVSGENVNQRLSLSVPLDQDGALGTIGILELGLEDLKQFADLPLTNVVHYHLDPVVPSVNEDLL